ncbi:MAG: DUF58 domain-containing protein [Firmicutes bacterium]|nr:DUF58 domain-containing protein [Bacillota bacterium]
MRPERILQIGLVVALIGIIDGNAYIIIPGGVLFLFGFISWFWSNYLPAAVTGKIEFSQTRVFYGDRVTGTLHLKNDQPFPLPWVTCIVEWPEELVMKQKELLVRNEGKQLFKSVYSMRGFERMKRSFTFACLGRGEYKMERLEIRLADPFGFAEGIKNQRHKERILVYPRMVPVAFQPNIFNNPFGGKAVSSWLYEDPANFRGIREYIPSDPFARISWKATARTGKLQTKMYDASFATEVTVVFNTTTSKHIWELNRNLLERGLVVAASLIRQCYEQGYRFSFYANSSIGAKQSAAVGIGTGEDHLRRCLETMARVLPYQFKKCEYVLATAGRTAGRNSQIYLVTALLTPEILHTLRQLQKKGSKVAVILTTRPQERAISGLNFTGIYNLPIYTIVEEEEWDELKQITFSALGS